MEKRNLKLEKAGLAIPEVLAKHSLLLPYRMYQAKRDWNKIVGEQIAKYSYILDFKNNLLVVAVMNPVYMNYLFMYKNKIIEEFNSYIGHQAIADVRFVKKGKKPIRTVYETLDGEKNDVFPEGTIRQVILDDSTVEKIRRDTAYLPDGLREKVVQLRFAQAKRAKAYSLSGFIPCPSCGRWMVRGEKLCLFCRSAARHALNMKVRAVLEDMPWMTWEKMAEALTVPTTDKAGEQAYNDVRRSLIYAYIEKVYYEYDTAADDLVLAILITRRVPGDIPPKFIENLIAKYRRKKEDHVSPSES
ncbi:DUF721 domain-containing protein [uncultured Megasphaera sp.]|uniref:DUF721 domain-containing protein n=1 Tax=uncultured Megasphaera sp. TaxID=165188 RepID=UPI0025D49559|nr:DUF721 domain-containing protein [uncultured Megasphaera sp.]